MKKNILKIAVLVAFCFSISSCAMHRHDRGGRDHHEGRPMHDDYHH